MKQIFRVFIFLLLAGCSYSENDYSYIKVFGIERASEVTSYNKGYSINNYLYYSLTNDSAFLRYMQLSEDSFKSYKGNFRYLNYNDSLSDLISYLKNANGENPSLFFDFNQEGQRYSGTAFEYKDSKGIHYKIFYDGDFSDSIVKINKLIHRLESSNWDKQTVHNSQLNDSVEVVTFLKGLGVYDNLIKPYVPLICLPGLQMDKLVGNWRTRGDRYNDATFKYWVNRIDSSGNWILERVTKGETSRHYTGKILSIKNNLVKVKSDHGTTTIEVLNLTYNCFEYKSKGSGDSQIWRLDRMN